MSKNEDNHKVILLNTFKAFISFCEKHNLKYVAAYGTVLGAIRHGGLIPWDDDIDVFMKREDYNKFVNLKAELSDSDYEILDLDNDGYYLPFAKFCDRHTTIWEHSSIPCVIGVFIDIFPVDCVPSHGTIAAKAYKEFIHKWGRYYRTLSSYSIKDIITLIRNRQFRTCLGCIKSFFYRLLPKKMLKLDFISTVEKLSRMKGDKLIDYTEMKLRILPSDLLDNTIMVPYEGININVPADYVNYLELTYGNWRELPPEEARLSHPQYYVNLDTRLTIEQIRTNIKDNDK